MESGQSSPGFLPSTRGSCAVYVGTVKRDSGEPFPEREPIGDENCRTVRLPDVARLARSEEGAFRDEIELRLMALRNALEPDGETDVA